VSVFNRVGIRQARKAREEASPWTLLYFSASVFAAPRVSNPQKGRVGLGEGILFPSQTFLRLAPGSQPAFRFRVWLQPIHSPAAMITAAPTQTPASGQSPKTNQPITTEPISWKYWKGEMMLAGA
jgi:hypothetical protein